MSIIIFLYFVFRIILFSSLLKIWSGYPNLIKSIFNISFRCLFFSTSSSIIFSNNVLSRETFLYFFIISYPSLWNVLTFIFSFFNFSSRFLADSLVKEIHSISSLDIPFFIKYFIFATIVKVFPLPAPAITKRFCDLFFITFFWYLSIFKLLTFMSIKKHLLYKIYEMFLRFPFFVIF